ncbi:hypothetical protein [Segetibacter koreensis]|uniref:hypothetical protein n=1 Tax=Segetibacter koreensis TaxID=398037 RepID=UPI0003668E87|nr:hypothetical protein [Segetibacter koreensis]
MKKSFAVCFVIILLLVGVFSCKKETQTLQTSALTNYFPLTVGKTYLYRLDSTVPASFGSSLIVKSYQAKDSIESTFTDNEGRLSYRIFRFTRDTLGSQPWTFATTFFATPTDKWIEYVDNNLRFLKLHAPIMEGYSWLAHSFIDTKSFNTTVSYLDDWEYEYRNLDSSYHVLNTTYDSTVTVFQHDETTPEGPFDPNLEVQIRTYGIEVFAKGVGLIYKEFLYWNWQRNPPPPKYQDASYGVKLQLISHN